MRVSSFHRSFVLALALCALMAWPHGARAALLFEILQPAAAPGDHLVVGLAVDTPDEVIGFDIDLTFGGGLTLIGFLSDPAPDGAFTTLLATPHLPAAGSVNVQGASFPAFESFAVIFATSIATNTTLTVDGFVETVDAAWNLGVIDVSSSLQLQVVPLPAAAWLLGTALVGLGALRARRRRG